MKLTSLRGCRNPEPENLHPSAAKSLLLIKMFIILLPGEPRRWLSHAPPGGDPKITENSIFFQMRFEWGLEGHWVAKMFPGAPQEAEKGSQMLI